jgi:hypothetical protein
VTELYQGELANGADDNGNGLVTKRDCRSPRTGTWSPCALTCQRRDDGKRLLTKTAETAVRLRNSGG